MPAVNRERVHLVTRPGLFVLVDLLLFATILHAQTINIRLVNGRSGTPVSHTCIDLGADHMNHMLAIPTDQDGIARFQMPDNQAEGQLGKRSIECGDWGFADPVLRHADTFSIHVGFVLCQSPKSDYSWLERMTFSTSEVVQQGVVTPNSCGKSIAPRRPGEVTIFVRPLNFWEKLKE